jgi:hypothetical protein
MQVVLDNLDPKLLAQTRAQTRELHEAIQQIQDDESYHNRLLKIAVFPLPSEQGKAHQQKQNMTNFYGRTPHIAGLVFSVARSVDNSEEYLGVQFVPELIQEGAWEEFQEEKAQKAQEAKERKEQRDLEAKIAAA